ncbi:MAG: hybrid sensor histidine kinase/response regulator [Candidatus Kapaibacterium sp.]|nr:MAG: hybrid sensor histidine kinase/response regulator [Candidatus Kapabacteria bacterium]
MKKVLIIEDEQFVRENIVEILETNDYNVISAPNGAIGARLAEEHLPDLILCDVMMPELDGHGVLTRIKSQAATSTIPFIFLTARADTSDLRIGMNLGADDYITKPFRVAELLQAVDTRLRKQKNLKDVADKKLHQLRENISLALPHEFLTPLSGILGFSELLLSSYDGLERDEIMEMLQQLNSSARRIHHLVQNFLLYAKLMSLQSESSRLRVSHYDIVTSPESIVNDVAISKAYHEQRQEDIIFELSPDVPIAISTMYFTKIIEEIVDNALKYSRPESKIYLESEHDAKMYRLRITNNGRPMTTEQIAAIGAYTQFDRQIYEQQGSGLGLSITQKLLELHDGHLTIRSNDNKTTVQIELPITDEVTRDN